MTKMEKLADTLGKFRPEWSERWRELCRQVADDFELRGGERERFLRASGAFPS